MKSVGGKGWKKCSTIGSWGRRDCLWPIPTGKAIMETLGRLKDRHFLSAWICTSFGKVQGRVPNPCGMFWAWRILCCLFLSCVHRGWPWRPLLQWCMNRGTHQHEASPGSLEITNSTSEMWGKRNRTSIIKTSVSSVDALNTRVLGHKCRTVLVHERAHGPEPSPAWLGFC